MEDKIKIVWVHDYLDGPMNGVVVFKASTEKTGCGHDKKLWFNRVEENKYEIVELSKEKMDEIEANHKQYCEELGLPVNYGDVVRRERRRETELGCGMMKICKKKFRAEEIRGTRKMLVGKENFENFYIQHRII